MKTLGTIYACGARTALGLCSATSALLLRTGLAGITSSALDAGEGEPVTMAFDKTLDPFVVGDERAALLARAALGELCSKIKDVRSLKLRVALALPEPRPGQPQAEVAALLSRELRRLFDERLGECAVDAAARGSAGLGHVLPGALAALQRREVDAVIAGGAHTDYDPAVIGALAATGRLFKPEALDAVLPGEAAAFVLIGRADLGHRLGLRPLCEIVSIASASSNITPYNDTSAFESSALAGVLRTAAEPLPDELRIGWAHGDHGIEHFRIRELYSAITRENKLFVEPMMFDSPPQRMGRTGAASLPLFLALAAESYEKQFAPSPIGLLLAGSDGGERTAIVVSSP